jgi:hypothetical protein
MKFALAILLEVFAALSASAGEMVRWRFEAVYSPSFVNEARDGETDAHIPVHSFSVVRIEKSDHPGIKRVTVGPFIIQSAESERKMKKIERVSAGDRVSITVEAPPAAFAEAEKSRLGELFVESDHIEVEATTKSANQALQHNDPSCHVPCLRTPRASRGRG